MIASCDSMMGKYWHGPLLFSEGDAFSTLSNCSALNHDEGIKIILQANYISLGTWFF